MILVQDVQAEGKYAIDSPGSPTAPEFPPEDYSLRKSAFNDLHNFSEVKNRYSFLLNNFS